MKYKIYSLLVVVSIFITVAAIYFIFGNSQPPEQKIIEIQDCEVYEPDEEILKLEHGDPT
ncbi:MAG: hypothetical protein J6A69_03320 [Clostridia bacterium]|nr:hypothetical protein [Clostridia bacterium]